MISAAGGTCGTGLTLSPDNHNGKEGLMRNIIYLVGLVVIVLAIVSFVL